MGCSASTPDSAPSQLAVAQAAAWPRLKLVYAHIQANREAAPESGASGATAMGLPDIQPKLVKLDTLPDRIEDLETGMDMGMRSADMRLLRISAALSWDYLQVYEDVRAEDFLQVPYKSVSSEVWSKSLALSWRWGKEKPSSHTPGWSPATPVQWQELKAVLHHASSSGMEHVWIDWSCMPQYSADTMTEVMRSKVYYVRAGAMTVLPKFNDLPDSGPVRILLNKASKVLKKAASEAVAAAPDTPDAGAIEGTVAAVLDALLEKNLVAGREYFGRAWTLAERMARYGRKERLCQWLSLEAWIGMVVDAMLKSTEDKQESRIYQKILGKEASALLNAILGPLAFAVENNSLHGKDAEGLQDKMAQLFKLAAVVWCGADIPEEAPSLEWLCQYLSLEVTSGMYKAFSQADLLWAVYSFFLWSRPARTEEGVQAALAELARTVKGKGLDTPGSSRFPWPSATYSSMGLPLVAAAAATEEHLLHEISAGGAILKAAAAGNLDGLKLYLDVMDASTPHIEKTDQDGATPLFIASENGHKDVVSLLLERGADIHKANMYRDGATPLYIAARKGHKDVVSLLLERGADINKAAKGGWTPLHIAAASGRKDVVSLLLERGADVNKLYKPQDGGWTQLPLYMAAENGHKDVVSLLLERGADINKTREGGATPLYIASLDGRKDVVSILLERGADVNKGATDGSTPLFIASQNGFKDVVSLLLERGADINKATKGWTPLTVAKHKGHGDVIALLQSRLK